MNEEKINKVSRAILIDDQGRVLLGRRVKNGGVGKYALIGGLPEAGETAEQTIVREVKEELGVDFQPQFFKEVLDKTSDPKRPWLVTFFTGPYTGELKLDPLEVSEIAFVTREDWDEYDITFNHQDVLKEFFASQALE